MTNEHHEGIPEDLEDGEIETDDENTQQPLRDGNTHDQFAGKLHLKQNIDYDENEFKSKSKKKKSKNSKRDEKSKDKDKHRKYHHDSPKEDFAENVERAIKRALKNEENENDIRNEREESNSVERKKGKKRKKEHKEKDSNKKRRKHSDEEVDESEMMFVRGASPTRRTPTPELEPQPESCENSSYESDCSNDSRNIRDRQRRLKRKKNYTRRREPHPMQEPDGICLYFMQGQCQDSDCPYSHDAEPPRKYELCKFYLMKCCAKGDNCLYMHSNFPCKYYHTGLPCINKDECKFAHGKPLDDNLKTILLKHIETAPKEILGEFPRMTRDSAAMMMKNAQIRLMQQYNMVPPPEKEHNIPSLFDLNVSKPAGFGDKQNKNFNKMPKSKQSRWQNELLHPNPQNTLTHNTGAPNVLNIKNLHGVLTPKQIIDLNNLGIDDLSQLSQLTVIQLNSLGLNLKQIHDIQMNTMSIQKLGLIESEESQTTKDTAASKDLDLRVAPSMPPVTSTHITVTSDMGMDVDMRFQPAKPTKTDTKENCITDPKINKDTIDIDQYRKDALKFIGNDKKSDEVEKENKISEIKDVDHRVLPPIDNEKNNSTYPIAENVFSQRADTDIRFLAPDTHFSKKIDTKQRISTTDDEDNNLLIDEKWYSSDDEKCKEKDRNDTMETDSLNKKEFLQKPTHRGPSTPPLQPPVIESEIMFNKLGDLSKIDISDQVSKLLSTMKNNLHNKNEIILEKVADSKPRDPRSRKKADSKPKDSVVNKSPMNDFAKDVLKSPTLTQKKSSKESIYSCLSEPSDSRRRTDVDLRQKNDQDFRLPTLGDTDLRQTPGESDIDFRLALPFKPIANYTPATEINGSINSHLPIPYKVKIVYIPRPDYTDIKNTTAKSQALTDPRLRKIFRLSTEEALSDSEKSTAKPAIVRADPRADPRRKPKENPEILLDQNKPSNSLDLQVVIQNSPWYKELSSNQKILVNQQLATITSQIKMYQQDSSPGKRFDVTFVSSNPILSSIFNNLGIILNEDGELSYVSENMSQQHNFPPNPEMFNMENRMNNMSMPPAHMPNMPLHQFNANFTNTGPRNAPGLLGIAPNMPFSEHFNHPNGNFNNFGGMPPFNGPVHDMDNRIMGRGFHLGRGNDRWGRGGRGGNRRNW